MSAQKLAFNLSTGADTGGAAIREVEAFGSPEANPTRAWQVRAMVSATNYIRYPTDLTYSLDRLHETYRKADVVHLNHTLYGHEYYDSGQGKPTVLEHHGLHQGSFVVNLEESIREGREIGAVQIGSTVNLELFAPKGVIEWAPIPYDLAAFRSLPVRRSSKAIRIAHAPTNRAIKSTEAFIEAVIQLRKEGLDVQPVIIEGKSNAECLKIKATCDILVDQLVLGYGCNAIEAWAMGLPVVAGISDRKWRAHAVSRYDLRQSPTGLPFFEASEANLADKLRFLVKSAENRAFWADLGMIHVQKWHSQAFSVAQMSKIYSKAQPTKPGPLPAKPLNRLETLLVIRRNRAAEVAEINRRGGLR